MDNVKKMKQLYMEYLRRRKTPKHQEITPEDILRKNKK